jgi:hypothetical protein
MPGAFATRWTLQPGHIAATPNNLDRSFDYALIDAALAKGYRVLIWRGYATRTLFAHYGPRLVSSGIPFPGGEILEVIPVGQGNA